MVVITVVVLVCSTVVVVVGANVVCEPVELLVVEDD